jgi:hypothetical protein
VLINPAATKKPARAEARAGLRQAVMRFKASLNKSRFVIPAQAGQKRMAH